MTAQAGTPGNQIYLGQTITRPPLSVERRLASLIEKQGSHRRRHRDHYLRADGHIRARPVASQSAEDLRWAEIPSAGMGKRGPTGQAGKADFLLGTDSLGRDLLSRTIYGARVSMVVGLIPTLIILIVGISVGLIAGYAGGWIDDLLMRIGDVMYAFPDLLFFIIVMAALRETAIGQALNGLILLFVALSIVSWVGLARLVRGQVLSLKQKEFVEAGRMIGATSTRIMMKHLLPNSLGPIIVSTAFRIPGLIITEAVLGYLGLGLRPSTDPSAIFITSWGALLLDGQSAINAQPWMLMAPAICVALVVLAFNYLGDGLRDALDPRMAGTE